MADAAGLEAVLAAHPPDGTYQDFVQLMVQAERGTGHRPSATFETASLRREQGGRYCAGRGFAA